VHQTAAEHVPPLEERALRGQRLGGFIYGTIVVLSVIVAGARAYPHGPGHVAVLVLATCSIFWLAHVYSHALGHSLAHGEHVSARELTEIARREAPLVESALPPTAALALGSLGVLSDSVSLWVAFALGLGVLGIQGIVFARLERLGPLGTAGVVAANLALGLVLVALKLLVSH
jgi:hypothetical protein